MIRRLRRRHLIVGTSLLALAPIALLVAGLSRPAPPKPIDFPGAPAGPPLVPTEIEGLSVAIGMIARSADSVSLVANALTSLDWADPLLYWSPSAPVGDALPEDAVFITRLSRRAALATIARSRFAAGGTLLIVDGAARRVVKTAPAPPDFGMGE